MLLLLLLTARLRTPAACGFMFPRPAPVCPLGRCTTTHGHTLALGLGMAFLVLQSFLQFLAFGFCLSQIGLVLGPWVGKKEGNAR